MWSLTIYFMLWALFWTLLGFCNINNAMWYPRNATVHPSPTSQNIIAAVQGFLQTLISDPQLHLREPGGVSSGRRSTYRTLPGFARAICYSVCDDCSCLARAPKAFCSPALLHFSSCIRHSILKSSTPCHSSNSGTYLFSFIHYRILIRAPHKK